MAVFHCKCQNLVLSTHNNTAIPVKTDLFSSCPHYPSCKKNPQNERKQRAMRTQRRQSTTEEFLQRGRLILRVKPYLDEEEEQTDWTQKKTLTQRRRDQASQRCRDTEN